MSKTPAVQISEEPTQAQHSAFVKVLLAVPDIFTFRKKPRILRDELASLKPRLENRLAWEVKQNTTSVSPAEIDADYDKAWAERLKETERYQAEKARAQIQSRPVLPGIDWPVESKAGKPEAKTGKQSLPILPHFLTAMVPRALDPEAYPGNSFRSVPALVKKAEEFRDLFKTQPLAADFIDFQVVQPLMTLAPPPMTALETLPKKRLAQGSTRDLRFIDQAISALDCVVGIAELPREVLEKSLQAAAPMHAGKESGADLGTSQVIPDGEPSGNYISGSARGARMKMLKNEEERSVLTHLLDTGPMTVKALMARMGVTRPTLTKILRPLSDRREIWRERPQSPYMASWPWRLP